MTETKDDLEEHQFKWLVVVNMSLWAVHDILIKAYVALIFDLLTAVASTSTAYQIWKENRFY